MGSASGRHDDVVDDTVGQHVVAVAGEIDLSTSQPLAADLGRAIDALPGAMIVVDLAEVTFMDSSGLSTLVGALKRAQAGQGTVALAGCQRQLMRVLEITGLTAAFTVFDTVEGAVRAAKQWTADRLETGLDAGLDTGLEVTARRTDGRAR